MRPLFSGLFALSLSIGVANAGEHVCLGGNCPDVDAAVRLALEDVGLTELDSYTLVTRKDGTTGILLASHDDRGLATVADLTGTRVQYVRGLEAAFLEVPFSGATTIAIGGLQSDPGGVTHTDRDMEPGNPDGGPSCTVCECTEDGIVCWQIC